jgi:hypothetical protein
MDHRPFPANLAAIHEDVAHRQSIQPDSRPRRIDQGRSLGDGRQRDVLHDFIDGLRLIEPCRHDAP